MHYLFAAVITKADANKKVIAELAASIEEMRGACGTNSFKEHYQSFMSLLADHMQIFGPLVAPYLPALTKLLS